MVIEPNSDMSPVNFKLSIKQWKNAAETFLSTNQLFIAETTHTFNFFQKTHYQSSEMMQYMWNPWYNLKFKLHCWGNLREVSCFFNCVIEDPLINLYMESFWLKIRLNAGFCWGFFVSGKTLMVSNDWCRVQPATAFKETEGPPW